MPPTENILRYLSPSLSFFVLAILFSPFRDFLFLFSPFYRALFPHVCLFWECISQICDGNVDPENPELINFAKWEMVYSLFFSHHNCDGNVDPENPELINFAKWEMVYSLFFSFSLSFFLPFLFPSNLFFRWLEFYGW